MKYFAIASLVLLLNACQTDASRTQDFAGRYDVTLHLKDAKKEMESAKLEVEKEMQKAQEEIKTEMAKAREDVEAELGEDSHIGKAVGSFVEGMSELAQGMTELGKSLGKMGINLGQNIVDGLEFKANFEPDGSVQFGSRSRLGLGTKDEKFWEIKDGKFYLGEKTGEKTPFEMKDLGNGEWELVGEDVRFHLKRAE